MNMVACKSKEFRAFTALSLSVSSACYASRSACGLVLGQLSELMQWARTTIKAKNDDRTAN